MKSGFLRSKGGKKRSQRFIELIIEIKRLLEATDYDEREKIGDELKVVVTLVDTKTLNETTANVEMNLFDMITASGALLIEAAKLTSEFDGLLAGGKEPSEGQLEEMYMVLRVIEMIDQSTSALARQLIESHKGGDAHG